MTGLIFFFSGVTVILIACAAAAVHFLDQAEMEAAAPVLALALASAIYLFYRFSRSNTKNLERFIKTRDASALLEVVLGSRSPNKEDRSDDDHPRPGARHR